MAFLDDKEIHEAYVEATKEADIWRKDYPEYERLADNGLLSNLDETLPEVNDGSLAASLFKLPKRIVSSKLRGRVKALDDTDDWKTELANIEWTKRIVPNANMQAPFHRKWKDGVRKAAIYGGQPIVNLFVENGTYSGSDFIVPLATDIKLEAGKVSDYDSDIIFWDVYYTKSQVQDMIDEATEDQKDDPKAKKPVKVPKSDDEAVDMLDDGYNKWNIQKLKDLVTTDEESSRAGNEEATAKLEKGVKKTGVHFYIAFQRGVSSPFKMVHTGSKTVVREWSNPDPTGDVPVHYIYCYQDFINPYGIGICKLAGGTQNVLDYMRQADVLATQIGLRPPKLIEGDDSQTNYDSLTYTEDADWIAGNAKITRQEIANGVYNDLPNRIAMYKTSLNQLIPVGDTSITSGAGDPNYSKTPQGVKFQQSSLSIDDEDFKDNFYITYAAVAKSMINIQFANMDGSDERILSDEEREILAKAGIQFPTDENGKPVNKLNVEWEKARATFDFEVDPSSGVITNDQDQLAQMQEALKLLTPQTSYYLGQDGWKLNLGEAYHSVFTLMNLENVDKIITQMTDEEKQQAQQQPFPIVDPPRITLNSKDMSPEQLAASLQQGGVQAQPGLPAALQMEQQAANTPEAPAAPQGPTPDELALKHRELDIKQQAADQKNAELVLKAHQQGHQQGMDQLNHVHTAQQAEVTANTPTVDTKTGKTIAPPKRPEADPIELPSQPHDPLGDSPAQHEANIRAIMEQYAVSRQIAEAMLAAEKQGLPIDQIIKQYAGGNQ